MSAPWVQIATALGLTVAVGCRSASFGVTPAIAYLDIDARVGIGTNTVQGHNSEDALGLEKDPSVFQGRAEVVWETPKRTRLSLSSLWSEHGGTGVLESSMSQGPVVIPAGTPVDSTFDLGFYSAVLTFDLAESESWEAALGFGAALIDLNAGFTSRNNGDEIFTDETAPVPLLAARFGWSGDRFGACLAVSGIQASFGEDQASFLDGDLAASYRLLGRKHRVYGSLDAGWRWLSTAVDYEDSGEAVDARVQLNGPYIGIGLHL